MEERRAFLADFMIGILFGIKPTSIIKEGGWITITESEIYCNRKNFPILLYYTQATGRWPLAAKIMFGHITGKIFDLKPTKVIVKSGGVGFLVHSTIACTEKLKIGHEADFWTYTAVRENAIDLYGFPTEEELRVFELLLTVSGIGPKSALGILGVAGVKAIEQAVGTGDTSAITKISGIGKKTAEKIVLELSGKLVSDQKGGNMQNEDVDVFEALKSLGYREKDIQEVIKNLPKDLQGTNVKIKYVLKNLGK